MKACQKNLGGAKNGLFKPCFYLILFAFFALANLPSVHAGTLNCQTVTCEQQGFPPCFVCNTTSGQCDPTPSLCDDGNSCTLDQCLQTRAGLDGCVNISIALLPDPPTDLAIECYICEPTENGVTVDNGICDREAGENCTNSPDCQVVMDTCIFPNSPTDAPGCTDMTSGPAVNPNCSDGDVCTENLCDFSGGIGVCMNPERNCDGLVPDGCCPSGCVGPIDAATGCPVGTTANNCDLDCWPPQSCGDGYVQPPETCDDSADAGDAGISPSGTVVTNADCRDAGTAAECTYCGDGIIQTAAGEECDGTDLGTCGTEGCDATTCLCNVPVTDLLVQGSGEAFNCSLNPYHGPDNSRGILFLIGLGFVMVFLLGLRKRVS